MGLFKKKTPRVIRTSEAGEEREVRTVDGYQVTIRKPSTPASKPNSERRGGTATATKKKPPRSRKPKQGTSQTRHGSSTQRRRPPVEIVEPPETARKQMLVRTSPNQTQIVVLEGPVLVEHYVAHSDRKSLVGNVYVGKVRNVLPGMEAAFIDFGEGKNGVLYAGDINYSDYKINGASKQKPATTSKPTKKPAPGALEKAAAAKKPKKS